MGKRWIPKVGEKVTLSARWDVGPWTGVVNKVSKKGLGPGLVYLHFIEHGHTVAFKEEIIIHGEPPK